MAWRYKVSIKHLLTDDESHEGVQRDMNAVADALKQCGAFTSFDKTPFRSIPEGDEFFSPADYANRLLERMYDYADRNRIWIN